KVQVRDMIGEVLKFRRNTDRLLLVVDQWEELYTQCRDEIQRNFFIKSLLDATECERCSVVLTLRGDFYDDALSNRDLADRLQDGVVNIGPMTRDELRRAIVEPANKAGLSFQDGLVDSILADVGSEPGNLPLLEFLLTSLWDQRAPDHE